MRYTQYKAFEKHLDSSFPSNFSSLYCLIIKDPAERSLAFDELKRKMSLSSKGCCEEKELLAELDAFSLFSGKQIIHFQGCEKLSKSCIGLLEKKIPALSPLTTLVLSGESFQRQSSFYKLCEKHGVILDTGEEKAWEKEKSLAEWLFERAHLAKKTIELAAVNTLARGSQGSFAMLFKEWEKLLVYTSEKSHITLADVEAICCLACLDSNFALGESILAHKSKEALETAHRMLDQGVSVFPLLRSLRHQMTTALQLVSADKEWISQKLPYLKGQMLEKQMQAASRFGSNRLIDAIQMIDAYEFKAKNGCDDPKLLLTMLCTRIIP